MLMVDNQPAIALAKNPVFHARSKHINTSISSFVIVSMEDKLSSSSLRLVDCS